jgi:hypothetical protein
MLSYGANVIIWYEMISSGANVIMLQNGAIVIIWCYHVMLSFGMIAPPFFIFPENFTHYNVKKKLNNYINFSPNYKYVRLARVRGQRVQK